MNAPTASPSPARHVPEHARRLTYLLTSLNMGGAQAQVVRLADGFRKRGWDARVISMIPAEAFTDELEAAGVPWVSLGMTPGSADFRAIRNLRRVLREWRPAVLHGHMVHANLLARLARITTRVPVVISTAHNITEGGRVREIAYRLTDPLSDHTTNVSQAAVDRYVRIGAAPEHKISFMPNGIDTTRFRAQNNARQATRDELGLADEFVWFAAGRFEDAKDYPNMFSAIAYARRQGHDAKLIIAGAGPDEEALRAMVREQGLSGVVTFLGLRSDIPDLMRAADGYLMSSAWEGLPMVLLEAAASSLPIVATDVGGNREVAIDGVNAFLAPARQPEALAAQMTRLAELSADGRRAMGAAGRDHVVATYDLKNVLDRWNNIYAAWLERRGLFHPR